eukprot:TRINITY_DN8841_c0_g1_i1.p1 TRINITY_DN8841_c0_g1~~TRINITY_DN8841_c0_g1_i1.p1  ORF type:complete len:182 (-),score=9.49 TRINITY_DN8841_c0_g1_i1:205-750(-)
MTLGILDGHSDGRHQNCHPRNTEPGREIARTERRGRSTRSELPLILVSSLWRPMASAETTKAAKPKKSAKARPQPASSQQGQGHPGTPGTSSGGNYGLLFVTAPVPLASLDGLEVVFDPAKPSACVALPQGGRQVELTKPEPIPVERRKHHAVGPDGVCRPVIDSQMVLKFAAPTLATLVR